VRSPGKKVTSMNRGAEAMASMKPGTIGRSDGRGTASPATSLIFRPTMDNQYYPYIRKECAQTHSTCKRNQAWS